MKTQYYDVKIEVLAPVTLLYRIQAESPEQALEMAEKQMLRLPLRDVPRPRLNAAKRLKIFVYRAGQTIIEAIKNF
jgi:hypothetical protein